MVFWVAGGLFLFLSYLASQSNRVSCGLFFLGETELGTCFLCFFCDFDELADGRMVFSHRMKKQHFRGCSRHELVVLGVRGRSLAPDVEQFYAVTLGYRFAVSPIRVSIFIVRGV